MIKKLTCPSCKQGFKNILLAGGAVCCPHCRHAWRAVGGLDVAASGGDI